MMSEFRRAVSLEPSSVNTETGEFGCTLFTNGEATDGHLIDVGTLDVPESIPMFVDHVADPTRRAGRLHSPLRMGHGTQVGDAKIQMTGRVDLEGDGPLADIRRDLFHGIVVGDVASVSGRWRSTSPPTPRAELAKAHYAYRGGAGFFFENAVALEGSIVGLGADPKALIGRSQDDRKPEHVREFWRAWGSSGDSAGALAALAAQARQIPDLVEIETSVGAFYVPAEVAGILSEGRTDGQTDEAAGAVEQSSEPPPEPIEKYLRFLERLNDGFADDLAKQIEDGIVEVIGRSQRGIL